jgi:hypothetical protein
MSSLLCNKPKPVLQQFSGELPKVDSAYYTQCLVRYKSSLYDDNLALTFNI